MSQTNYSSTKLQPVLRSYGCRSRLPHDLKKVYESKVVLIEQCHRCGRKLRFRKHYRGRVDNRAYLAAHARNFAQPYGRTERLYQKIYHPTNTIIRL